MSSKKTVYTIVGVWFLAWAAVLGCGIIDALVKASLGSEYIQANYLQILESPSASNMDVTAAMIVALFKDPTGVIAIGLTIMIMAVIIGLVLKMANR